MRNEVRYELSKQKLIRLRKPTVLVRNSGATTCEVAEINSHSNDVSVFGAESWLYR